MKTSLILLLIASSVAAFAPNPIIRIPTMTIVSQGKTATFMSGQDLLETDIIKPAEEAEAQLKKADECEVEEEELTESQKLLKQVKEAGTAGFISYAAWEVAFWFISVPVCVAGYKSVTGHFPDFSNKEDMAQLGAEAFAFVNFARFAVPLRIGLALGTTPWVQDNVVDRFLNKKEDPDC